MITIQSSSNGGVILEGLRSYSFILPRATQTLWGQVRLIRQMAGQLQCPCSSPINATRITSKAIVIACNNENCDHQLCMLRVGSDTEPTKYYGWGRPLLSHFSSVGSNYYLQIRVKKDIAVISTNYNTVKNVLMPYLGLYHRTASKDAIYQLAKGLLPLCNSAFQPTMIQAPWQIFRAASNLFIICDLTQLDKRLQLPDQYRLNDLCDPLFPLYKETNYDKSLYLAILINDLIQGNNHIILGKQQKLSQYDMVLPASIIELFDKASDRYIKALPELAVLLGKSPSLLNKICK